MTRLAYDSSVHTAWLPATPTTPLAAQRPARLPLHGRAGGAPGGGGQPCRAPSHCAELPAGQPRLDVEQLASAHGEELPAQALAYLGAALGRELRRFDRVGHCGRRRAAGGACRERTSGAARSWRVARSAGCTRSRSRSKASANRCASPSEIAAGARGSPPSNCSPRRVSPPSATVARGTRCRPSEQGPAQSSAASCRRSTSIIPRRALRVRAVAAAPDGRSRPCAARRLDAVDGDRGAWRAARRGLQRRAYRCACAYCRWRAARLARCT